MERKQIQEQRMRGYFIQATKELLKGEGLHVVNVRSVAERAGYSYATLYNYFKDLNELIFECVKDFQKECEEDVASVTEKLPNGKKRLARALQAYAMFFVQYPGIFDLFFLEKMKGRDMNDMAALIWSFPDRLCEADWTYCRKAHRWNDETLARKQNEVRYFITGLLLFYMNRRNPAEFNDFRTTLTREIDEILGIKK